MFHNDMSNLEKRLEKLEESINDSANAPSGTPILLDFNRGEEHDHDKVLLLTVVPPKEQWKVKRRMS